MSPSGVQALNPGELSAPYKLNKQKHINYWKRCLKTYLPTQYTSTDSNRMLLAFFIVSALDLLGVLHEQTTVDERNGYIDWIYRCEHPEGGFRGFPGTDFGLERNDDNKIWDPANVPATYLALSALLILGDDLSRVKRRECLQWLRKLQRDDGGFGETLGENNRIEGGQDSRFGYCAIVVRWILRGAAKGDVEGVLDIDVDRLTECVKKSQVRPTPLSNYFAEAEQCLTIDLRWWHIRSSLPRGAWYARICMPLHLPTHSYVGGFTYCAISILALIRRLPRNTADVGPGPDPGISGLSNVGLTVHWLVSLQTTVLAEEDEPDGRPEETVQERSMPSHQEDKPLDLRGFGIFPEEDQAIPRLELQWAGFSGRCNKIADTCYCFWTKGALSVCFVIVSR